MLAFSKHALVAIGRRGLASPVRRCITTSIVAAVALGALPSIAADAPPLVQPRTMLAASGPWLDRLNQWRTSTGLPLLTENALWSQGDYNHSLYMVKNNLVTHYETPGVPYYTTDGDTAARSGNIQVSSNVNATDSQAIDWWMAAPFHAMNMMDPRLTQTGFGAYRDSTTSPWHAGFTLDTIRGNTFSGGQYPVYFPGNGTAEPLTTFGGGEFPDPLQGCPGYGAPTGLPVFIEVGGNVSTTVGPSHSFTGNGVALAHCVIDSSNAALGSYLYTRGGVILIPRQPLQNGVRYTVALTVNGVPYTWSFTVGQFTQCGAVSASTAPVSPSPVSTTVTITSVASGCPDANPQYEIWMRNSNAPCCQLLQPYGTSATFQWNTTGLITGTYYFSVWAKDANSPGAFSNSLGRYDAAYVFSYALGAAVCTGVTASEAPASPQAAGTGIAITGAATGCSSPLYEFFVLYPNSQQWLVAKWYSASPTYSWNSSGLAPGVYTYQVWARGSSSPGTTQTVLGGWDAYTTFTYQLTPPCTSVAQTTMPSGTASAGTPVTVSGKAAGCPSPLYEFWMLSPGAGSYIKVQPYSTSASYSWTTTGAAAGTYGWIIFARDTNSTGTQGNSVARWDAYAQFTYTLH